MAGEEDEAQQIVSLYTAGDTVAGDARLESFLRAYPDSERRCELLLASSRGPLALPEAVGRVRRVMEECPAKPEQALALADLARLYHLSGQDTGAMTACRDFLERYPDHELAPEILLLQGALEMTYQGGRLAGNSFAVFLARYPDHPQAVVALVGVADAKAKNSDWAGAHQVYRQALAADPSPLDMPKILFYLGFTAEMCGQRHPARYYYSELLRLFGDSVYAGRARERVEMFLSIGHQQMRPPEEGPARYAVCVGVYDGLSAAEQAAKRYIAAGLKVHYLLRGQQCRLLVGEFTAEVDARLYAQELKRRFQTQAEPMMLP